MVTYFCTPFCTTLYATIIILLALLFYYYFPILKFIGLNELARNISGLRAALDEKSNVLRLPRRPSVIMPSAASVSPSTVVVYKVTPLGRSS